MSLSTSLSIAVQAIGASTAALQATNNNIANSNTPGYSREVPVFQAATPTTEDGLSVGSGVVLERFQSVRDELLQGQIQQETQNQSGVNAQLTSMQQIEPVFTTSTQDVGTQMSALFASLSSLSTNPASGSSRQAVLLAGQNLVTSFNTTSSALTTQQSGLNAQVTQDVTQINSLSQQIAALNPKIAALKSTGQDGGTLQDQQDQLVLSLSALINLKTTNTDGGVTVSTANGTPLVVGSQAYALQTGAGAGGNVQVLDANGTDVTSTISAGDLGGTIQTRDKTIPGLLNNLDTLVNQFGAAFNAAQAKGFDQNGKAGGNFFTLPPTVAGAAAGISMAITSSTQIAASSDGSAGSSGNIANFTAVQTTAPSGGQTPPAMYANLVYQVGSLTANANAESSATTASLLQLNDQRNSVSGVSIDEESTNLITYQQSYQAAARVISTIQALFQITMSMGTSAAE